MSNPQAPHNAPAATLGHRYGVHKVPIFKGTGKSGLTPVSPILKMETISTSRWKKRREIEEYQMWRYDGWTGRELEAMEAMAAFGYTQPGNLDNEIHPLYAPERWEVKEKLPLHLAPIPLGNGLNGYWEFCNPIVGRAIQPCLKLASLYIFNSHMWPWWDALLLSRLEPIDTNLRGPSGKRLFRFRSRAPDRVAAEAHWVRQQFIRLCDNLMFSFGDGRTHPWDGYQETTDWQGVTVQDPLFASTRIQLDQHMCAPLLRSNLTPAERMMVEFRVAITLVHETAHAIWGMQPNEAVSMEPYFEDEPVSELGASMTNSMLDGAYQPLGEIRLIRDQPVMTFARVEWPNRMDRGNQNPVLFETEMTLNVDTYPIPVEYFSRIQQEDFWTCQVWVFGAAALHLGPLTHGRRYDHDTQTGEDRPSFQPQALPIVGTDVDPKSKEIALAIEENRLETARRVSEALMYTILNEAILEEVFKEQQMRRLQEAGGSGDTVAGLAEISGVSGAFEAVEKEVTTYPAPPRYLQIVDFLFKYRTVLALDTMSFEMPELTLLAYINRLGEIFIEKEEWRQFLLHLNYEQKALFTWLEDSPGTVFRSDVGWPPLPVPVQREFIDPPADHINLMELHMRQEAEYLYYARRFPDIDMECVRRLFNHTCGVELDQPQWARLVAWCDRNKEYWILGPPGVMRYIPREEMLDKRLGELLEVPTGDMLMTDFLTGNIPVGNIPTGDVPTGDVPTGDVPTGDVPTGIVPTGIVPTGNVPTGDVPTSDVPTGDVPMSDVPTGDVPTGDAPAPV